MEFQNPIKIWKDILSNTAAEAFSETLKRPFAVKILAEIIVSY